MYYHIKRILRIASCIATFGIIFCYEYDPDYLVTQKCRPCDARSCPQLTFCAGKVVKDHCGCCSRCSSDLYQPHAPVQHPPLAAEITTTAALITVAKEDLCKQRKCPSFKVCLINTQGLPLCTCPSLNICGNPRGEKESTFSEELCGTDGVTYKSRCHLKIANCNSDKRIKKQREGACAGDRLDNIKDTKNVNTNVKPLENGVTDPEDSSRSDNKADIDYDDNLDALKRAKKRKIRKRKNNKKKDKQKKGDKKKTQQERNQRTRGIKRMKRRNKHQYDIDSKHYSDLISKRTLWGESQIRKSRI